MIPRFSKYCLLLTVKGPSGALFKNSVYYCTVTDNEALETPANGDLAAIADTLLEECEEDIKALAGKLDGLPVPVREDLLCSDFFNALQAFYYYFRTVPEDIEAERLLLVPASELQYGIRIDEIELLDLIFGVIKKEPVILVSDGDQELARFTGMTAYRDALEYIRSTL